MSYLRLGFAAGILILIMGMAATTFYYRGNALQARAEATQARADLATAVAVNKANEATMARLKADKDASEKLAAELADEIDAANTTTLALSKTLTELRAKNAEVNDFLQLALPPALRLYFNPKTVGGH